MIETIGGANELLARQALARRKQAFAEAYGQLAIEDIDAQELETANRLLEAAQSLPFLSPKKLVIIRKLSTNKLLTESLNALLEGGAEGTELVFYEPGIDKRGTVYKTLKKQTTMTEFTVLDERQLAQWLVGEAKDNGGSLSVADALYLIQRVGTDQTLVNSELDKLLLYAPAITRDSIELLTEATPQSRIFDLLDAAFMGNHQQALTIYEEQRVQKVEPQQIMAMLAWQLHIIALVKHAGSRSPEVIAAQAGINPYVAKKSMAIASRLTIQQIRFLLAQALDIDVKSKTTGLDLNEALKTYLVTVKQA